MKLGFIGTGNMGQAMICGVLSKDMKPSDVMVCDLDSAKLEKMKEKHGVEYTTDNKELTKACDIIVLAVKPQTYGIVMAAIRDEMTDDKIIVTIAPGHSIESVQTALGGENIKVVRTMPNTPAMVCEGMAGMCASKNVTKDELASVKAIFESFGRAELISENQFDTVTGISGSSPAYTFMFIEAMADAAVLAGMPRDLAYKFSAQAVAGAAKMVIETGTHPGELKDMVCSPGGTTIEAVAVLEQCGFRAAVINAVHSAVEKAKILG